MIFNECFEHHLRLHRFITSQQSFAGVNHVNFHVNNSNSLLNNDTFLQDVNWN